MIHYLQGKRTAKQYARAFFNCYPQEIGPDFIQTIKQIQKWQNSHTFFFRLLQVSVIPLKEKEKILKLFYEKHQIPKTIATLITLLVQQRKTILIPTVLDALVIIHKERDILVEFDITTSQELTNKEKETLCLQLEDCLSKKIAPQYFINHKLISGIKIQSTSYYWEESIARKITVMAQAIKRQIAL